MTPNSNHPDANEMGLVNYYYNKFTQIPLKKLISQYDQIELDIIEDMRLSIADVLRQIGFVPHANVFVKEDFICRFVLDILKGQRSLVVTFQVSPTKGVPKCEEREVNGFGLIRRVIVEGMLPFKAREIRQICNCLATRLIAAYAALETAFIQKYEDIDRSVFRNLYGLLETHLKTRGKEHLIGRVWFFIAEDDVGFFYFDVGILRKVMQHYKKQQQGEYSPFELTVWIMSEPLPFEKTLSIETMRQGKPLDLVWSKARFIDEAPKTFLAELFLYSSDSYTAYVCCKCRGFYLSITFPTDIAKDVLKELDAIQGSLDTNFQRGIRQWSPYVRAVKRLSLLSDESRVARFIGTILGKAASELIKGN